ncbi:MAG: permease-like cell division protein FtsX [Candidatus Saccharibacteria bacterium]|jgi:cell division transport system permease protein|nr:permease-like cell division protein FtsX [Candidatus Saccharibacteria bacterium]
MSQKLSKEEREELKNSAKISKERLNRITKTRKHHLRTSARVMKYGAKSFVRNTWLSVAAIAIMAITLIVLSATLVATHAMNTTIEMVESQVDMSIYVKQGATNEQINKIISNLEALDSVTSVTSTSPEEANNESIRKLIAESNITDKAYIQALYEAPNKIPWTINVKLKNLNDTSELERFVDEDPSMTNMLDARPPSFATSHRETIDRIASIMNRVEIFGLGAAAIFALIAILIVFNTIRMAIFNRKEEIYMMHLVGASHWFIMGPFVVEASLYGVVAAGIAGAAIYATVFAIRGGLGATIEPTIDLMTKYWYFVAAGLLAVGILIGVISALLASRKYIKTKTSADRVRPKKIKKAPAKKKEAEE